MAMPEQEITMAAISGPGDPLVTPELTLALISQIKELYPRLKVGIKTYGIGSDKMATALAKAGLHYVEIQVDAMRSELLERLYAWIRPGHKTLKISDAAPLLITEQRHGVAALKFHEIKVCIQTTLFPGYNIDRVSKIAREMGELGADAIALIPHVTAAESDIHLESPTAEEMEDATRQARKYLPVVTPLFSPETTQSTCTGVQAPIQNIYPKPTQEKPNVAVVSSTGMEVDLHLGHAGKFLIYGPREDGLPCLLESRNAPAPGKGKERWLEVLRF